MLSQSHNYAEIYRHAFEVLQEQDEDAQDVEIRLHVGPGRDPRRYNLPTSDDIAVILPGDGASMDSRDIILRLRNPPNQPLQRIYDMHPAYPCLHYVLLFPYGEAGWHYNLMNNSSNPRRITQLQFNAFRLYAHMGEFNTVLRGGRLFQQFIVDMWVSTDQNRLRFLRNNQGQL